MSDLAAQIRSIGEELVQCRKACEGISCDHASGQIPRCLFLDVEGRSAARGSAVVGLNPGRAAAPERTSYVKAGGTYNSVVAWYNDHGRRHPYVKHLQRLLELLELGGPVLWTELAKCENSPDQTGLLPLQTFRTCTATFLDRELEVLPPDWPLLAVGVEVYKALAYRFPSRTVLGLPHPTGSRGHFANLFDGAALRADVAKSARSVLLSPAGMAVWLGRGTT
jgi:hypothetical protein